MARSSDIQGLELVTIVKCLARHWRELHEQLLADDETWDTGADALKNLDQDWRELPEEAEEADYDVLDKHPMEEAITWIHERTGIDSNIVREAAWRINSDFGLRAHSRLKRDDLTWIFRTFKELDRDGSTAELFEQLVAEHGELLIELGLLNGKPKGGSKKCELKWRKAQNRMFALLQQRKLPTTVRQAAKQLNSEHHKYNTVLEAARKSATLSAHFKLNDNGNSQQIGRRTLGELAEQADPRTREFIQNLTLECRQETEAAIRKMSPAQALEMFNELQIDPDAGRSGEVSHIENADQDARRG